ncbi:hypothetical protein CSOJ01_02700 [Colletotrichum sojae]|uniref:Uncharacterized protein n=1 Tax=Colletotrichum sojae TaxID=2175907 RepID=A0A8H6JQ84_9PEZI|nr:hypothetical protein CSOJ01_02700 [Colletotrichum sojae]
MVLLLREQWDTARMPTPAVGSSDERLVTTLRLFQHWTMSWLYGRLSMRQFAPTATSTAPALVLLAAVQVQPEDSGGLVVLVDRRHVTRARQRTNAECFTRVSSLVCSGLLPSPQLCPVVAAYHDTRSHRKDYNYELAATKILAECGMGHMGRHRLSLPASSCGSTDHQFWAGPDGSFGYKIADPRCLGILPDAPVHFLPNSWPNSVMSDGTIGWTLRRTWDA